MLADQRPLPGCPPEEWTAAVRALGAL